MNELREILNAWRGLPATGGDAVLATVVHMTGSTYRRPGARMLLLPDGRRTGSVSGGCLEGVIAKKAWWWTGSTEPALRVFDTTSSEDAIGEFGLGCNGVVHVLLERVTNPGTLELLEFLETSQSLREPAAVATVIRASSETGLRTGQRLLVCRNGATCGVLASCRWEAQFRDYAATVLETAKSGLVHFEGADVFIEYVEPPPSLTILGAGLDAQPVAVIAKQLGWFVTVADGRSTYARPDRFPGADRVVVLPRGDLLGNLDLGPDSAVVMMTHNYPLDLRLLPCILSAGPRYLGLLGPRTRAERLFDDLGMEIPGYVHSPAGLDIGGDGPASVALSIVAEIQAAFEGRAGGMLKYRSGSIHFPVFEAGLAAPSASVQGHRLSYCEVAGNNV